MVQDIVVLIWGPDDLLGRRAPGFKGAVDFFGQNIPSYDLFLIGLSPVVLGGLWLLFQRTRWGVLVRAATQDRDMVAALGVNQKWLFTSVFALGVFLAALGGALQIPRDAVHHAMDLRIIVEVFVVVVIGGLQHCRRLRGGGAGFRIERVRNSGLPKYPSSWYSW
jgi:branched-chain amino acid transport system permease protein